MGNESGAWCSTCGRFRIHNQHTCPPAYQVWCEEHDDGEGEARIVYAYTHEEAAELWARRWDSDSAEYLIVSGKSEPTVSVRKVNDEGVRVFQVFGESVPDYNASEVKPPRRRGKRR